MITCPFCYKEVHRAYGGATPLENESKEDFQCQTYAQVGPQKKWCHYSYYGTQDGRDHPVFVAILPPFYFTWSVIAKRLKVYQLLVVGSMSIPQYGDVCELIVEDHNQFVQMCKRFKTLTAFS